MIKLIFRQSGYAVEVLDLDKTAGQLLLAEGEAEIADMGDY